MNRSPARKATFLSRPLSSVNNKELASHVAVIEERLARVSAALVVLLEAISNGKERETATAIWEELQRDLELPKAP